MYEFKNLKNAASFALRASKICLVFDGPDGGYVVAFGREACELEANGLQSLSLQQVAKAAKYGASSHQWKA